MVIVSVANRRTRQHVVRGFDSLTIRSPERVSFSGVACELGSRVFTMSYSGTRLRGVPQGMTSRVVAFCVGLLPLASLAQLVRATDF